MWFNNNNNNNNTYSDPCVSPDGNPCNTGTCSPTVGLSPPGFTCTCDSLCGGATCDCCTQDFPSRLESMMITSPRTQFTATSFDAVIETDPDGIEWIVRIFLTICSWYMFLTTFINIYNVLALQLYSLSTKCGHTCTFNLYKQPYMYYRRYMYSTEPPR